MNFATGVYYDTGQSQQRKKYDMKSLKKLHRVFGHPSHEKLEILLKDAGEKDPIMLKMLKRIHTCCSICSKYKRKMSKPKVALPKAREINETVSLDLKAVSSITGNKADQRQIVYCVDEFSKWTAAGISKNKEAECVIKVVLTEWCLKGLGYPSRSFFTDNRIECENNTQ